MSAKLTCPHCEEDFKPKQPVEAGKKTRCPKCGEKFTAPEEDAEPEDRKKSKSGRKGKAKEGSNTLMIAGIVGGAIVLLLACGGGGVGIWWFTKSPSTTAKKDKSDVAKGTDKTDGPAIGDKPAPNDKSKPPSVNDQAFLNDPKWKSGNEARRLIVGTWYYAQSTHLYEFQADGKMFDKSPQVAGKPGAQFPFTYRITDPQKLSLAGQEYRLLISQDEMYMVSKSSVVGPYVRK